MSQEILKLQRALKQDGLYAGTIDGDFGPLTLSGVIASSGSMPHMLIAAGEFGVAEIYGIRDNPRIRGYHSATTLGDSPDEVPWCSSFANWVLKRAGKRPTRSAMARSWLEWGESAIGMPVGSIAVLTRGRPPSGHVGFLVHATSDRVWLLGGNQADKVCVRDFPIGMLLSCRVV